MNVIRGIELVYYMCPGVDPHQNINFSFLVLSSLRVMCTPRDPKFAGSNPAEVDGFFQDIKILSISPLGGNKLWVPSLTFQAL